MTPRKLYYANGDGDRKPQGPVGEAALRALHVAGTVTDRTWVIEEGGKEWLPYARFFTPLPPVPASGAGIPDEGGPSPFLTRLLTAAALALPLSFAAFVLLVAVGGAVVGAQSGAAHPGDTPAAYEAGREAGTAFGQKYAVPLFLGALGLGTAGSAALAFSGVLPWCRRKRR